MGGRILVVDDEMLIRWSLNERLTRKGYEVSEAEDVASAAQLLANKTFDLAFFDLRLPDGDGLSLLKLAQETQAHMSVIIITAYSTVDNAIEAMKCGAYDYISKPFKEDELVTTVERALDARACITAAVEGNIRPTTSLSDVIGSSAVMREIKGRIQQLAREDARPVLVVGDTGTGKDLMARVIHDESARRERPFMSMTCTAMSESLMASELFGDEADAFAATHRSKAGLFELSHGGTVVLDEIGNMQPALQAKLLQTLEANFFRRIGGTEDIPLNCRIIASSSQSLAQLTEAGETLKELCCRLGSLLFQLPPLQERSGDIPELARHFLGEYAGRFKRPVTGFTAAALQRLENHPWPGNVRELRNVIERAVLMSPKSDIDVAELMLDGTEPPRQAETLSLLCIPPNGCKLDEVERILVSQALEQTRGNQTQAARLLGVSRN